MTFRQKYVKSFDGTRIGYQVAGEGKNSFILCNGLGGSMPAWEPIYTEFGGAFKFITWDYRGLFTSDVPENRATLSIPCHVEDLRVILAKEKVRSGVVGGWSMGTQVSLEFYRNNPEFFRGIFLLNGTYGYPLKTALHSPLTRYIVPVLNGLMKRVMPHVQHRISPVAKKVISTDEFIRVLVALGLVHRNFNTRIFRKIADDIVSTNMGVYHDILDHLAVHDAADVMAQVRVPTLIVAGTRDLMTPSKVAHEMADRIPYAELMEIHEGSHYALMEFPELINGRLRQFLTEHGLMGGKTKTLSPRHRRVSRTKVRK